MLYLERIQRVIDTDPTRPAFKAAGEAITYGEVSDEAARIYRRLKEAGIGHDQIVCILMPKGIHFFSAMLGVWRAGAAFVLVEDTYPAERIRFIIEDTKAALVIDQACFDEIMATEEPLAGWEERDPHDLAYVVFTSGSTGTPKGIMHEYGNVDRCVQSVPADRNGVTAEEKPLLSPLSFVHAILNLVYNTMDGLTTMIEPQELLRDFNSLKKYILEKKLTYIYLPPSYIRIYHDPSPFLETIGTGSEPASGLYYEGGRPTIVNTYSLSEAGFAVMRFALDHAYDLAPIGRPLPGVEVALVDEDDNVLEGPATGELCIKSDFFRGYLNQPELTAHAKRGGYFHTADICRRDEDGIYSIVGRVDDMVKINGNRIEPGEIEAAVQRVSGLSKVIAKGFADRQRSYVAAYFLRQDAEALGILEGDRLTCDLSALTSMLPGYMIPTYYVPIDELPLTQSGKVSRKTLEAPDVASFEQSYVAPTNEVEETLCEAMAKVLGLERVGIKDDFFMIGGDSMHCIELVSAASGLDLSSAVVYRHRTPERIATNVSRRLTQEELDERECEARTLTYPLLPGQKENYYCQLHAPESGFLNQYFFWRMRPEVTEERLVSAVNRALAAHPSLNMRVSRDEEGTLSERLDMGFAAPVVVEEMSEAELEALRPELQRAFELIDVPLYRARIFKTERALYFYGAVHHIICDGGAMKLLGGDILRSCAFPNAPIEPDRYFSVLREITDSHGNAAWREAQAYFKPMIDRAREAGTPLGLAKDRESELRTADMLRMPTTFSKAPNRTANFFLAACALAEAWYNGSDSALITTIYACRDDHERMNAFGLLVSNQVACIDATATPEALIAAVDEQMEVAIAHSDYSYIDEEIGDPSNMVRYIYQKDIYVKPKPNPVFEESISLIDRTVQAGSVSISIIDNTGEDQIRIAIRYATSLYDKASIERYASLIVEAVDYLEGKASGPRDPRA